MPASPLTVAMMGGQGDDDASSLNPAALAITPQLSLAQSLLKQGMDTSAASPWQALARVAQAGAGTYLQQSAVSDLSKAYARSAKNMAQIFPQGSAMRNALTSDDPGVWYPALQQAGKGLTQMTQPEKINPDQQVVVPGSGPLSSSTNPQTPVGKLGTDIQQAQRNNPAMVTPLGRALTKDTTEGGIALPPSGIPSGPPRLTSPVATPPPAPSSGVPAGIQLPNGERTMGSSAPITPTPVKTIPVAGPGAPQSAVATPPPAPQGTFNSQAALLPGYAEAKAAQAGATTAAEETAKNAAEYGNLLKPQGPIQPGPGTTEPIKTAAGTMIPAVKEQGPIPSSPAELKEAVPAWQKTQTEWNASIAPAQQAEQRLQTIASAFKQIQTGSFQTNKATIAAGLKSIGIDLPDSVLADPAQVQLALHENYAETLSQLKTATPRFSQMEFKVLSGNKEHPDLQPAANLQMLAEDIGMLRQARDLPSDFTAAQSYGWKNPQQFEQSWMKQNPLSGYVSKVKQEIGPLKGMPGAQVQGAIKPGGSYVWTPNGLVPK